jgi:hypothetical protein
MWSSTSEAMFKWIVATLGIGIGIAAGASQDFSFQGCEIAAPAGWRESKKKEDVLVLRSPNGQEQATITAMRFRTNATFEDFKRLCETRVALEKKEMSDGFVSPSDPYLDGGGFGMMFSGGDKQSGRLCSGYLTLTNRVLITVYVEGIRIPPKDHLATFKQFVSGLKRK